MAIAFDTAGSVTGNGVSSSTVSLASTGSDRVAIIVARWFSATYSTPTVTVNGSGTGVTQVGSTVENLGDSRLKTAVFRLVAPPTSAVNYVATYGGSVDNVALGVVTYTGVDQSAPITGGLNVDAGDGSTSTAATITLSSATGEVVVAALAAHYPANGAAEDGGQTERIYAANWNGTDSVFSVCEEAGAASVTQSWTITNAARWNVAAVRLAAASAGVSITNASDESFTVGESVTIECSGAGASQGSGSVIIVSTDDVQGATFATQTVTSWADDEIQITVVKGSLSFSTNVYLFVITDGAESNAAGYVVQIVPVLNLKVMTHSSAAGATNVAGVVFAEPTGGNITGAKIGEFTGASFNESLESGQAVLTIPTSSFSGGSLTTSDTPVVLVRNTTNTTGIIPATVIEA